MVSTEMNPHQCSAYLRINDTLAMSGEQITAASHIGKSLMLLHLGGVPSEHSQQMQAPLITGFVGCMQKLRVNTFTTN